MDISLDSFGLAIKPIIFCDITTFQQPILNHGYSDLPNFPSWQEFADRSNGLKKGYENYVAYVVFKNDNFTSLIGVVAIQLNTYESLKDKVPIITPGYNQYLYLSWIAIDASQQDKKYFEILFYFYKSIVKQLAMTLSTKIAGAAIVVRRMRSLFFSLLNRSEQYPETTKRNFDGKNRKMGMVFMPSELLSKPPPIPQDFVMINFYTIDESISSQKKGF